MRYGNQKWTLLVALAAIPAIAAAAGSGGNSDPGYPPPLSADDALPVVRRLTAPADATAATAKQDAADSSPADLAPPVRAQAAPGVANPASAAPTPAVPAAPTAPPAPVTPVTPVTPATPVKPTAPTPPTAPIPPATRPQSAARPIRQAVAGDALLTVHQKAPPAETATAPNPGDQESTTQHAGTAEHTASNAGNPPNDTAQHASAPERTASNAATPEKTASVPSAPAANATRPASKPAIDEALTMSNEAAAAGMRSVLDASRREVLKQNLAREGINFVDETLQPPTGPTISLQQVVAMAVSNYPSIRAAMATVGQQQAGVDVARAGYYPTVQVGINTGHQGTYGAGQAASASVSQMLYDFGKVKNAVTSAQSSVLTSELQLRAEIERVATQAALTAVELERNMALETSARAQLDGVNKLLDLAKRRAELGASNRADPTQAEARVSAAQATLQSVKNQVSQRRTQLATLIGQDVPAGGVVVPPEILKQAIAGIHPDVQNAVNVQIAQAEKDTAAADLAEAKSNTKPTLSLQAGVSQYLGAASNAMPGGREYTLTLGVTHNIFEGGAPTARVRGASEALRGADERIQAEQLQAENDRRVYEDQIKSLSSRMETLKIRQARIVETQKLYKEQYLSLGTRSLLDLLNSEAEIFQAESDEINARHDLWAAEVSYINTTGYMRDVFNLGNAS